MVWICDQCIEDQHQSCESKWQCDCKCNVGGSADLTQKSLAIVGGTALAITGLAVTLCTGSLAAAFFGSAMLGAGFGSTWNATAKTIKGERIDGKIYANDVAFGAVTGVVTSKLGVTTESLATNFIQQAVTVGSEQLSASSAKDITDEVKQSSDNQNEINIVTSNIHTINTISEVEEANKTVIEKSLFNENEQATKVSNYNKSEKHRAAYQSAIRKYDSDIQAEISLRNEAIKHKDISLIQEHQAKISELMQQKDQEIIKLNSMPTMYETSHIECMNGDIAHFPIGDKHEQVNGDVKLLDLTYQRPKRKTHNSDVNKQSDTDYYYRLKVAETMLNNAIYNLQ